MTELERIAISLEKIEEHFKYLVSNMPTKEELNSREESLAKKIVNKDSFQDN